MAIFLPPKCCDSRCQPADPVTNYHVTSTSLHTWRYIPLLSYVETTCLRSLCLRTINFQGHRQHLVCHSVITPGIQFGAEWALDETCVEWTDTHAKTQNDSEQMKRWTMQIRFSLALEQTLETKNVKSFFFSPLGVEQSKQKCLRKLQARSGQPVYRKKTHSFHQSPSCSFRDCPNYFFELRKWPCIILSQP